MDFIERETVMDEIRRNVFSALLIGSVPGSGTVSREKLYELANMARKGDFEAYTRLVYAALPVFCSVYAFQTGRDRTSPELIIDCRERFLSHVAELDYQSRDYIRTMDWHIRQAHAKYIANRIQRLAEQ